MDEEKHLASILESFRNILVVAAHPDDEMLGCGGTLARLTSSGAAIRILLLGEGPTARDSSPSAASRIGEAAHASALAAAGALGIHDVRFAGFPDNRFDSVPLLDMVRRIEAEAEGIEPDLVLAHHAGDVNIDHVLAHRATMTAFRPLPGKAPRCILGFEVLSSTEYGSPGLGPDFHPTLYMDISGFLDAKQKALRAYATEMRPWPHPRSHETVGHLAALRGSQCGHEAAEGFLLYSLIA